MKPLIFVADSHRALLEFPKAVQQLSLIHIFWNILIAPKERCASMGARPGENVVFHCRRWCCDVWKPTCRFVITSWKQQEVVVSLPCW